MSNSMDAYLTSVQNQRLNDEGLLRASLEKPVKTINREADDMTVKPPIMFAAVKQTDLGQGLS